MRDGRLSLVRVSSLFSNIFSIFVLSLREEYADYDIKIYYRILQVKICDGIKKLIIYLRIHNIV